MSVDAHGQYSRTVESLVPARRRCGDIARKRRLRRPWFEWLESRRLLASGPADPPPLVVTTRRPSGVIGVTPPPSLQSYLAGSGAASLAGCRQRLGVGSARLAWRDHSLDAGVCGPGTADARAFRLVPGNHGTVAAIDALLDYGAHPRQPPSRLPIRIRAHLSRPRDPPATSPSRSRRRTGSVTEGAITTTSPSAASRGTAPARPSASSEEGYNPAFVDTSRPNYNSSRPGGLRQDLRPACPAQLDFRRPRRHTAIVHQQQQQQS